MTRKKSTGAVDLPRVTHTVPVVGHAEAVGYGDRSELREAARAAVEGCELHVEIDGVAFVITLEIDPHR